MLFLIRQITAQSHICVISAPAHKCPKATHVIFLLPHIAAPSGTSAAAALQLIGEVWRVKLIGEVSRAIEGACSTAVISRKIKYHGEMPFYDNSALDDKTLD